MLEHGTPQHYAKGVRTARAFQRGLNGKQLFIRPDDFSEDSELRALLLGFKETADPGGELDVQREISDVTLRVLTDTGTGAAFWEISIGVVFVVAAPVTAASPSVTDEGAAWSFSASAVAGRPGEGGAETGISSSLPRSASKAAGTDMDLRRRRERSGGVLLLIVTSNQTVPTTKACSSLPPYLFMTVERYSSVEAHPVSDPNKVQEAPPVPAPPHREAMQLLSSALMAHWCRSSASRAGTWAGWVKGMLCTAVALWAGPPHAAPART
ncbi:hypothetical protein EYF80_036032 [Liparis tanakae]|uniref:Uncharacterized protein n=1 Tax=Liparis tanakae TaxID=230148 RepID=A0A4Z2GKH7_9TELE|nr:hypothetical protein EYF80_036032 [Liparis tanakae]